MSTIVPPTTDVQDRVLFDPDIAPACDHTKHDAVAKWILWRSRPLPCGCDKARLYTLRCQACVDRIMSGVTHRCPACDERYVGRDSIARMERL